MVKKRVSSLHRTATTFVPLLPSGPGGVERSWSCKTYPAQRYVIFAKLHIPVHSAQEEVYAEVGDEHT